MREAGGAGALEAIAENPGVGGLAGGEGGPDRWFFCLQHDGIDDVEDGAGLAVSDGDREPHFVASGKSEAWVGATGPGSTACCSPRSVSASNACSSRSKYAISTFGLTPRHWSW